jgi:hypothetical protein
MLPAVLKSDRAVQMSVLIVRTFVKLREVLSANKTLAERIEKLEQTQEHHGSILVAVVQDIQKLKNPPITRAIGFIARGPRKK